MKDWKSVLDFCFMQTKCFKIWAVWFFNCIFLSQAKLSRRGTLEWPPWRKERSATYYAGQNMHMAQLAVSLKFPQMRLSFLRQVCAWGCLISICSILGLSLKQQAVEQGAKLAIGNQIQVIYFGACLLELFPTNPRSVCQCFLRNVSLAQKGHIQINKRRLTWK